ncbi:hypothetical protein cyc_05241 [Cyclospora cayetanensis]|uniref:Transmembrane protein n=1 Tax=Cyclospora cayetanensis TaxID=88456 RepID=A0A1D3CR52_9EIME|nr:hypothetical protein cyc_05241 [Cyclospora cayetanensis]
MPSCEEEGGPPCGPPPPSPPQGGGGLRIHPRLFFAAFIRATRRAKAISMGDTQQRAERSSGEAADAGGGACCCQGICDACAVKVDLRLHPFCNASPPQQRQQPQQQQHPSDEASLSEESGNAERRRSHCGSGSGYGVAAEAAPLCCEACAAAGCSWGAPPRKRRGGPRKHRRRRVSFGRSPSELEPILPKDSDSSHTSSDLSSYLHSSESGGGNVGGDGDGDSSSVEEGGGGVPASLQDPLKRCVLRSRYGKKRVGGAMPSESIIPSTPGSEGASPMSSPSLASVCTLEGEGPSSRCGGVARSQGASLRRRPPGFLYSEATAHLWEPPEGEAGRVQAKAWRGPSSLRSRTTLSSRRSAAAAASTSARGFPRSKQLYITQGEVASGSSETVDGDRLPLEDPLEKAQEAVSAASRKPLHGVQRFAGMNHARRALHHIQEGLGAAGDTGVSQARKITHGLFGRRQTLEHRQARVLRYHLVQKAHDRMPWWLARLVAWLDVALDNCRRRRKVMQKATWRVHVAMPVRSSFGLFGDDKIEHWYVQWLSAFNMRFLARITGPLLLATAYGAVAHALMRVKGFVADREGSIAELERSSLGFTGFLVLMGIRLLLQPLLTILVLLPILSPGLFSGRWYTCFFDSNKFSQGNGYVFSRLLVIASAIQLVFPLFDQSLHMLVTPNASSVASVLTPRPAGPIQVALLQMTVFLAMRDPTFVTACIACFVAVILSFAFLFLPEQRDAGLLVTAVTSFMFVAFTSRAFYTRTLEVNRRRLFCKYVLPYIMYLEEVALVLYAGSRGDEGDSDSSGSFASVGGLLQQPSSHPSLRLNPNATKSFGAWKAPSPYGGAPRRGTHGDRSSANPSMYRRPEPSRLGAG